MGGSRPSTPTELAHVYRALANVRSEPSPSRTVLVLVDVVLDAATAEWLHRFAVELHRLAADTIDTSVVARGVYLLGGVMHATMIPADVPDLGPAVVASTRRARLHEWARAANPGPVFTTMHRPGSDSQGVVQFRLGDREIVAKIGHRDAIAREVEFASGVNALLASEGRRGLFPVVHGLRVEGDRAVSLMEAGHPMPIGPLFADPAHTVLAETALDVLEPHLDQLAAWYRLTVTDRRPTVADYLYRERYHVLRETPAFTSTFRSLVGSTLRSRPGGELSMDELFAASVLLPGGRVVAGYTEAVAWLDTVAPGLLPDYGSAVHGDIYAANMLFRPDGTPMLIDPRPVWEGRDRPDVGYGDPVYDLATLLHGVFGMAAVLRAVDTGTTDALFGVGTGRGSSARPPARPVDGGGFHPDRIWRAGPAPGTLDLSSLRLPVVFPPAVRSLEARLLRTLPRAADHRARTRLYIGAATSLAGWLKYERSLRTPAAWLATYAFVIWYLWRARQLWDGDDGGLAGITADHPTHHIRISAEGRQVP